VRAWQRGISADGEKKSSSAWSSSALSNSPQGDVNVGCIEPPWHPAWWVAVPSTVKRNVRRFLRPTPCELQQPPITPERFGLAIFCPRLGTSKLRDLGVTVSGCTISGLSNVTNNSAGHLVPGVYCDFHYTVGLGLRALFSVLDFLRAAWK